MSRYAIAEIDALKCKYSECKYIIYGKKDVCYKHYMLQFNKQNYAKNKEQIKEQTKKWYFVHHEEQKLKKRIRQKGNPYYAQKSKEYWIKNKEILGAKNKASYDKNKIRYNKNHYQNWKRPKYYSDPEFRLKECLSARMRQALKHNYKSASTEALLGCTISFLREHLEQRFKGNMTWDNYGEWHVDHIMPCDSFNLLDGEEQRKCFHYTNLQPLWATENIVKSNKIETLINK